MKFKLIKTPNLTSIQDHLEFDDSFLNSFSKNSSTAYLRLWEIKHYHIVLGRSNHKRNEVKTTLCDHLSIKTTKRCSGGGTVILGPGCMCYSIFIPTHFDAVTTIPKTNNYVMTFLKQALNNLEENIKIKGYTDLCINNKKFSGNSQRRLRHVLLFHGTIMYNFDLDIISKTLKHPSKEPDYRKKRTHLSFLTNFNHQKQII